MTGRLAKAPGEFLAVFVANFNEGHLDSLVDGYTTDAVLDLGGANVCRGHGPIRAALANFLAPKLPITATQRRVTESADTAVVVFDWTIDGRAPDGVVVKMGGTAIDILSRGADGFWRQRLDLPFGSATAVS